MIQEEAPLWRDLYRVLFDRNIAGIILTNPDGRILDCNDRCARIFGFDSKEEMLGHSAWDFYFHRAEREVLLDRLRTRGTAPTEEVCMRGRTGLPVWVLAMRTVASFVKGRPTLLQGTVMDITAKTQAQARRRDRGDAKSATRLQASERAWIADISQKLANLHRRAGQILEPANLPNMGKPEIKEFLLVLEEMKMLVAEFEVCRFLGE